MPKVLEVEDGSVRFAAVAKDSDRVTNGNADHSASSSNGEETGEEDGRVNGKRRSIGGQLDFLVSAHITCANIECVTLEAEVVNVTMQGNCKGKEGLGMGSCWGISLPAARREAT